MQFKITRGINNCFILHDPFANDLAGIFAALDLLRHFNWRNEKCFIYLNSSAGEPSFEQFSQPAKDIEWFIGVGNLNRSGFSSFFRKTFFFESLEDFLNHFQWNILKNAVVNVKATNGQLIEKVSGLLEENWRKKPPERYWKLTLIR